MKNSTFLLFIIFVTSCHSVKQIKKKLSKDEIYVSDRRISKKEFFPVFKRSVFISSIQYSFNNSPEIKKILAEDKSNYPAAEVLDIEDVNQIAKIIANRIKQDSAKNTNQAPDDLRGKTVFKTCLDFYNSSELDSIARQLYKVKYSKPYILSPKK